MPTARFVTVVDSNNRSHVFYMAELKTTGIPFLMAAAGYGRTDNKPNEDIKVDYDNRVELRINVSTLV
jgi:hypothetical protein